jgi:hypothetical protein
VGIQKDVFLSPILSVLNLTSNKLLTMALFAVADAYVLVIAATFLYVVHITRKQKRLPYPPGPRGHPLIGSALEDFGAERWISYRDLSVKYGKSTRRFTGSVAISRLDQGTDILHLNMAGTHLIILNSAKTATELLEKRSINYSDR